MGLYKKRDSERPAGALVYAEQNKRNKTWILTHKDGSITTLSNEKFQKRYEFVS